MKTLAIITSVIGLLVAALPSAEAAMRNGMDLESCRFKDGSIISPTLCEKLRLSEAQQDARNESQRIEAAAEQEIRKEENARRNVEKAQADERAMVLSEQRAKETATQEAYLKVQQKKAWAEQKQYEREELAREKKQDADNKSRKIICGDDFASPKIGMTIERAQQCVAKFKLVSQLNRADGVISMYHGGGIYLHVMEGRIVSWQR